MVKLKLKEEVLVEAVIVGELKVLVKLEVNADVLVEIEVEGNGSGSDIGRVRSRGIGRYSGMVLVDFKLELGARVEVLEEKVAEVEVLVEAVKMVN